jgi:hypothetical protein
MNLRQQKQARHVKEVPQVEACPWVMPKVRPQLLLVFNKRQEMYNNKLFFEI